MYIISLTFVLVVGCTRPFPKSVTLVNNKHQLLIDSSPPCFNFRFVILAVVWNNVIVVFFISTTVFVVVIL